jgi:hypothetical protein
MSLERARGDHERLARAGVVCPSCDTRTIWEFELDADRLATDVDVYAHASSTSEDSSALGSIAHCIVDARPEGLAAAARSSRCYVLSGSSLQIRATNGRSCRRSSSRSLALDRVGSLHTPSGSNYSRCVPRSTEGPSCTVSPAVSSTPTSSRSFVGEKKIGTLAAQPNRTSGATNTSIPTAGR